MPSPGALCKLRGIVALLMKTPALDSSIRVFAALLVGTALTVIAAKIDLGVFNPIIALGIACTKAVIVILFFMHVKYQSKLVKLTVISGFFTFIVLITMTLTDYISRAWGLW